MMVEGTKVIGVFGTAVYDLKTGVRIWWFDPHEPR